MKKRTHLKLFYALFLAGIMALLFCLDPSNPDDPSSGRYIPTKVDLSLLDFNGDGIDTVRGNITTETPIVIDFQAEFVHRIDTILIDIDAASGTDQQITVIMDTLSTAWIDNSKYALPAFKYDKGGIYEVTVTVSMRNGQDDIVKKFFIEVAYVPTEISVSMGNRVIQNSDTVQNGYTTDKPVIIDFMAAHISRIDTIFIDADINSGIDQQIVIVPDTMTTKWIDNTKYALPSIVYRDAGIYAIQVTVSMRNNQADIVKSFYVSVAYNPTTATFLIGDVAIESVDTINTGYTTETPVQIDFSGKYVFRIQSITIDIDANSGEDANIVINADTLSTTWSDSVRYSLTRLLYPKAGKYQLTVTAKMRNSQSNIAATTWLKIAGQVPAVTLQPVSKNVNEGDSVSFRVVTSGSQPIQYAWYKVKKQATVKDTLLPLVGKTSSVLMFDVVMLEDSGSYVCIVNNEFGSIASETITLNVKVLPPDINSPVVSFAADSGSGIEGNGGAVKVRLSKKYSSEVSVSISTLPTTTAAPEDFTILTQVVRFGVNETEKTFTFTTVGNAKPEADRKIVFFMKAASRANIDTTKSKYTYIIYDDDTDRDSTWPKVEFEKSSGEGLERDVAGIRLLLSKSATYEIKIKLKLLSSSSTDATDFVLSDSIFAFAPNEVMKLVALNVKNDNVRENDENVLLQIQKYDDSSKVSIGTRNIFTYTIHDDDTSLVYFGKESDGCIEGDTTVRIPVMLSSKNTNPVTVQFTVATPAIFATALGGGKDYSLAGNNSLTIGSLADTGWIELKIHEDAIAEEDEIVTLILTNVSGGSVLPAIPDTFFYKIRDDENTSVGFESPQTDVVENIGDTAIVHVWLSLTGPVQDSVLVQYNVSGGDAQGTDADYEVIGSVPQTVLVRPGETRIDIKVKIIDDKRDEKTEYFDLQIIGVTGGSVKLGSMNIHRVRIIDDDIPFFYCDTLLSSVSENAGKVRIPVRLSTPSDFKIHVRYAVAGGSATGNGSDYRLSGSDTITFDEEDTLEYIEVDVILDVLDENNETIVLNLLQLDTTALPKAGQVQHTMTIIDQNSAPGAGFASVQLQLPEDGSTVNVPVSLASSSGKAASVQFQIRGESANWNGGDVVVQGHTNGIGILNFTEGEITKNITVTSINDRLDDDNESFTITLFNPNNCILLKDSTITISIVDDDYKVTVQSSGNGTVSPNGDTIVARGSNFQIRARAAANYHFAGWTPSAGLAVAGQYDTLTTMSNVASNGTVTATFLINSGTVTLAAGVNGNAYVGTMTNGDIVRNYNSILSFDSVKADPNYHFKEWTISNPGNIVLVSGTLQSSDATFQIRGSGTITPIFAINSFRIMVKPNNIAMGTTVPNDVQMVDYNSFLGIVAQPATNHHFMRWEATGGVSNANLKNRLLPITSLDSVKDSGLVTAYFGIDSNTIQFTSDNTMGSVGFNSRAFPYNDSTSITATPLTGYHFVRWQVTAGQGNFEFANASSRTTMIRKVVGPGTVAAIFAIDTFTVTIIGSNGTVTPSGGIKVPYGGSIANISAGTPTVGYGWSAWSLVNAANASITPDVSSQAITLSNIRADNFLTGNFVINRYTLSVTLSDVDGVVGGTATLAPSPTGGTYTHGTVVKIKITRVPGWRVSGWSENAAPINGATSDSAIITMNGSAAVTISVAPIPAPAGVICVKNDALRNGNGVEGSSWIDAYQSLTEALAAINSTNKTLWIARGTYIPSTNFTIPLSGVALIGGFDGTETAATQRDSLRNTTILDGQIDAATRATSVVNVPAGSDNVLLSTLTIRNAGGGTTPAGGIYAYNANDLTIFRCVITNNSPYGIRAGIRTTIKQCAIINNSNTSAGGSGAGINIARDGVMVMQSIVANNSTTGNGAGISLSGTNNNAFIIHSDIVNNTANGSYTAGLYRADGGGQKYFIANSIIWGNTIAGTTTAGTQLSHADTVLNSVIQSPTAGTGIGVIVATGLMLGVSSVDPTFTNTVNLPGVDAIWFNNDDGLMPAGNSSVIDKATGILGHSNWNPTHDIRNVLISRVHPKNYDIGAYDQ